MKRERRIHFYFIFILVAIYFIVVLIFILFIVFILIIIISPCSPIPFVGLFFSFSLLPKLPTYLVGISEVHIHMYMALELPKPGQIQLRYLPK